MTDKLIKPGTALVVPSTAIVRRPSARAPRATNIELANSFADTSLEMDGTGKKFRVSQALQNGLVTLDSRVDALEAASGGGGGGGGGYYLTPPAVPNAFNDEFDSGSPDPIARGWSFIRCDPSYVAMTRVGEVYPRRDDGLTTALTASQFRSSIKDGKLFVQLPTINGKYLIYKPMTVGVGPPMGGAMLWARITASRFVGTDTLRAGVAMLSTDAGTPNINVNLRVEELSIGNTAYERVFWGNQGGPSDVLQSVGVPRAGAFDDIKILTILDRAPGNMIVIGEHADSASGGYFRVGVTNTTWSGTVVTQFHWAAIYMEVIANSAPSPYDFVIDFARLHTGDLAGKWIGNL